MHSSKVTAPNARQSFCASPIYDKRVRFFQIAGYAPAVNANRLAGEKSPYLLQHAGNPVEWFPWGEEAFVKARRENKPIFLSIGYSTCHWCHVMAHESFEDAEVAEMMNRDFVNIKVDREERPDVDRVYMTFVQATTGGGGWPMSVWLTPDLKPFVGGTYFPPQDRYGQPSFRKIVQRIARAWRENGEKIALQAESIVRALQQAVTASRPGEFSPKAFEAAYAQFARSFDPGEGGFGGAPKFPRPVSLNFLTRFYARAPHSDDGQHALEMVLFTLRKMAGGGIHDHIGGGFHRYSVDGGWHVPHFEKMLYDQGQLASAYLDAFQISREPLFESVARDILDYVARDLTSADGGFYSAEDADSAFEHGKPERGEGAFYLWKKRHLETVLGKKEPIFSYHYGVQANGNVPAASDPHGEFTGKNVLIERHSISETAARFEKTEEEALTLLADCRAILLRIRSGRPRPERDEKIIAAWNGLTITAFARAAQVLGDGRYLEIAQRAARFVRAKLYDQSRKILLRTFREGSGGDGFAEDYAFIIQGMLDLYQAGFETEWLRFAFDLQAALDAGFFDEEGGGYFTVTGKDPSILLRMKDDNDSAEPAASSLAALNLARLAAMRNDPQLLGRALKTAAAFASQLSTFPTALPQMLVAIDFARSAPTQVVVAGAKGDKRVVALLDEIRRHFLPRSVVLQVDGGPDQTFLSANNPAVSMMMPINGEPAVYVCKNFTCQLPVTDTAALARLLAESGMQ